MRKIVLFCLVSCMLFSLCACSTTESSGSFEDNAKGTATTDSKLVAEDTTTTDTIGVDEVSYSTTVLEDLKDSYLAEITVENYGVITLKLDSTVAPITVSNFVTLANDGFYDGLTFHRIMDGFMMQGGDPLGTGMGGSDVEIKGEFMANGVENTISHKRGVISMARAYDMNSASSQFFIVHEDSEFLDGNYAGFGEVISGMEVVDAICSSSQPIDDNGTIPAESQPIITSIVIKEVE